MSPLDLLVAAPLGFMIAALLLGAWARWSLLAAIPVMAGLAVWLLLLPAGSAHVVGDWNLPLGVQLRADGLAQMMVGATAACASLIGLYALHEFAPGPDRSETAHGFAFWPLFYLLWGGANTGFLSTDLFNLYIALEMVSLAAVAMAAMGSLRAALRYFVIALVGSLAYLLGVALLFSNYATVDLTLLAATARPDLATKTALAVMTAGLLIKAAVFPLHGWLPPAHAAAPAPASALLSAIVVKVGFVILLRLWFEAFPTIVAPAGLEVLGWLGALAVLYGSVQAIRQNVLKALVAYSTVAQIGYLLLAFPLVATAAGTGGAWAGMTIHAVAHLLAKAAMFLAAGLMLEAVNGKRLEDLRGLARAMPLTVAAFGLAAVSLMGLPPSVGFIAKFLLLEAAVEQGAVFAAAVLLIGGLLGAVYLFSPLAWTFAGSDTPVVVSRAPLRTAAPLALALLAVSLGFAGQAMVEVTAVAPWAGPPTAVAVDVR
ncbi:proton-conducting transporter membrane subunit [Pelagibacterium flavum]|uniref:Proton-conducting transporter membrane subunit n=1 Tax=Pelagibacterium flavum TaxID=2984530 RepID=A0ABY6ISN6_9HYPH|nr:proton-conducting transporter membrane subunit [Pelagibacterium sp. YIM 151497]UYQ73481.1 proton-conducting transporter membrane subunit [Pelagibacterium sp. YIM 151497]